MEHLLKAELTAHLGYPPGEKLISSKVRNGFSEKTLKTSKGEIRVNIPRDREGTFDPDCVPKYSTMTEELEKFIIRLYAKGMSNADILDLVNEQYGVKYSTSQISVLTVQLLENIRTWQNRTLSDIYPFIAIDAIHYKIRHEGKVISKAIYVILGNDLEGKQDIFAFIYRRNQVSFNMGFNFR